MYCIYVIFLYFCVFSMLYFPALYIIVLKIFSVGECSPEVPRSVGTHQCRERDEEIHVGTVLVFPSTLFQIFMYSFKGRFIDRAK